MGYVRDVIDYKAMNESGICEECVDSLRSWCYGARWQNEQSNQNEQVADVQLSLSLIGCVRVLSISPKCVQTLLGRANFLNLKILFDVGQNDILLANSIQIFANIIEQKHDLQINESFFEYFCSFAH